MAILKKKQAIGKLGKIVLRQYRKQVIAQSAPGKGMVKQTEPTKKTATLFGKASTLGAIIRKAFSIDTIRNMHDGEMTSRLTSRLRTILAQSIDLEMEDYSFHEDSFESLNGFDFNIKSPIKSSMWTLPKTTFSQGTITITLPELIINKGFMFPKDTNKCELHFSLLVYDLLTRHTSLPIEKHTLELTDKQYLLEKQSFSFTVPDGCLCMIGVSLRFNKDHYDKGLYNSKTFNPSGIFGAILTPGTFKNEKKWKWEDNAHSTAIFGKSATTDPASLH